MTLSSHSRLAISGLAASALGSCDLVSSLPVITPGPVFIVPGNNFNALNATITSNNAALQASLSVVCEVDLQVTSDSFRPIAAIAAVRGQGPGFTCLIPPPISSQITSVHNVRTRWQVFSPRPGQPPLKVAESPHVETQLGNCNAATRTTTLNNMRDAAFGALPLPSSAQPTAAGIPRWNFSDIIANLYVPTHGAVQFAGMGVAFIRMPAAGLGAVETATRMNFNVPNPTGAPDLLFFLSAPGSNVTDVLPDDPYTLVGWAFAQTITQETPLPPNGTPATAQGTIQKRPLIRCIRHHEWMVHAKGIHKFDGTFSVGAGSAPGLEHEALWDLHFFLSPAGSPAGATEVAITRVAGGAIAGGVAFNASAFFQPTAYD